MGVAAYNRGTKVIRMRLDMEQEQRRKDAMKKQVHCHEYIDWRNGETVRTWYDDIGPCINQNRDKTGRIIRG